MLTANRPLQRRLFKLLSPRTSGVFAIAPTPFQPDGGIDAPSIDRMCEPYRAAGCAGLTILGIMGEAPKLDMPEAIEVVKRVIRRAPDLGIIVGVSAPGFAAMRTLASSAMDAGAAGVMIAPIPSLRTDDQIVADPSRRPKRSLRISPGCCRIIPSPCRCR